LTELIRARLREFRTRTGYFWVSALYLVWCWHWAREMRGNINSGGGTATGFIHDNPWSALGSGLVGIVWAIAAWQRMCSIGVQTLVSASSAGAMLVFWAWATTVERNGAMLMSLFVAVQLTLLVFKGDRDSID
jgi:hypothetical protein